MGPRQTFKRAARVLHSLFIDESHHRHHPPSGFPVTSQDLRFGDPEK